MREEGGGRREEGGGRREEGGGRREEEGGRGVTLIEYCFPAVRATVPLSIIVAWPRIGIRKGEEGEEKGRSRGCYLLT